MILEIATTTLELGGGELSPLAELAEGEQILPDKALSKSLEARDFNDIGYNLDKDLTPIERLSKNEAVLSDRELSKSVEAIQKLFLVLAANGVVKLETQCGSQTRIISLRIGITLILMGNRLENCFKNTELMVFNSIMVNLIFRRFQKELLK